MTIRRPASIVDVAKSAGVSTATVSRLLNNPELVAPETAARVQRVISELGYRPNVLAQGLMTRKLRVLGIALPDIHGEFYSELLRGADAAAHQQGYHLLVSSEAHLEDGEAGGSSLAFGLIGGLALMLTEPNESLWVEANESGVPLVVLDTEVQSPDVDSVVVNNTVGAREATEHLLAGTPAAQCYFVGGPAENFDTQQRAAAFAACLRAKGWNVRPEQTSFGEYSLDWGRRWAEGLAQRGALAGAAVLAGNDEIALGIMQVALDSGLAVPQGVRIVGFDDTRLATLVRPQLSAVRYPMAEVGRGAIEALIRRIEEPTAPRRRVQLSTSLVVRDSSRL